MRIKYLLLVAGIMFLSVNNCLGNISINFSNSYKHSQKPDSSNINKKRLTWLIGSKTTAITGSMIMLDQMWYSDYPRSSFQFHNDNKDWKQLDKLGHLVSTYHISKASYKTFRWAGLNNKQSSLYGSITGTLFMTTIEVLDGFSKEWGFSWGDQAANFLGAGIFYTQQLGWENQRVKLRYSYSSSGLEEHRPDLFGSNKIEHLIKDYNGMTFWLSMNMNAFSLENEIFPDWLNIAIGYGANGMLGSIENPVEYNGIPLPVMDRYRQWYISPDIDLVQINTNSQFLQILFKTLDFVKIPAPAIEYNSKYGWQFYLIYF